MFLTTSLFHSFSAIHRTKQDDLSSILSVSINFRHRLLARQWAIQCDFLQFDIFATRHIKVILAYFN